MHRWKKTTLFGGVLDVQRVWQQRTPPRFPVIAPACAPRWGGKPGRVIARSSSICTGWTSRPRSLTCCPPGCEAIRIRGTGSKTACVRVCAQRAVAAGDCCRWTCSSRSAKNMSTQAWWIQTQPRSWCGRSKQAPGIVFGSVARVPVAACARDRRRTYGPQARPNTAPSSIHRVCHVTGRPADRMLTQCRP